MENNFYKKNKELSNSVPEEGNWKMGLIPTKIRKAEMPETTLLSSVCQIRASPLKVDGTRKGAIDSNFWNEQNSESRLIY